MSLESKSRKQGLISWYLHPWRITWNIIMEVWKIIFLSKWVICRFHVNLPGCNHHCPSIGPQDLIGRVLWRQEFDRENTLTRNGEGNMFEEKYLLYKRTTISTISHTPKEIQHRTWKWWCPIGTCFSKVQFSGSMFVLGDVGTHKYYWYCVVSLAICYKSATKKEHIVSFDSWTALSALLGQISKIWHKKQ